MDSNLDAVERAMVSIRRSQGRRSLARLAGAPSSGAGFDVLDAVEAAEQARIPATVTTVAAALGMGQPRASKLVTAAVDSGLVRREADQGDGRRALLVLTDAGRARTERVHEFRRSVFSAAMSDWTDDDRARFARLLNRFVAGLAGRTKPPG